MRIVRNKSIPNVDTDRLLHDLNVLHEEYHTVAGIMAFDGPRRQMIDNGIKALKIVAELSFRNTDSNIDCRFCGNQRKVSKNEH